MEEIWRDICDYEGLYQVSSLGNIRNLKRNKLLSLKPKKQGYIRVNLVKQGIHKTFTVHRLVALAFIPKEENKNLINHKNEIKSDNRVSNLEWCTHQYNVTYGSRQKKAVLNKPKAVVNKSNMKGAIILNDKAKEQRNAYMKEWRKRNKDKVKVAQERYWEKKFKEKEKECNT
ncbi:hypothetical protein DE167_004750 [Clostridium beijerinckii]|uniref:HNH endonuclease n=1 Tax=Clostridium beijerinckii TaxID=1520 RepID=A0AAX0B0H6_CLOBE|nr:hypothetical protein [Clostridium beijerinckii]NYC74184.1 hypothetical protein [Clostridium beijerinckii]